MKLAKKAGIALAAAMLLASATSASAATNMRVMYKGPDFVAMLWDYSPGENASTVYNVFKNGTLVYSGPAYSYTAYGLTSCTDYTFTVVPQYYTSAPTSLSVKTTCYP
ncbi:hypothetical protein ACFSR7_09830 [Cohnella sp. GCM10020058]|uniref:hypothetical protein n=1 Tax=Cohnella sp. GCM10020058 TaxID=3317330 RepID=UPI00362AE7E5